MTVSERMFAICQGKTSRNAVVSIQTTAHLNAPEERVQRGTRPTPTLWELTVHASHLLCDFSPRQLCQCQVPSGARMAIVPESAETNTD